MHKYTEAAVKIQTRYRAYKSTTIGSSKNYQLRAGSNPQQFTGNKLMSHYHHSSIDEASVSDFSNENCVNGLNDDQKERRTSGSDLQLNNNFNSNLAYQSSQYQPFANQKQIARKLINVRQSSRFSPASPSTTSTNSPLINNISNFSSSNLNSQFNNFQTQGSFFER